MCGECHAHMIMDGVNYKAAVALHRDGVCEAAVRRHLAKCRDAGVFFVRDGGDAKEVSKLAKKLAPEYGIDYRTPIFAIHKRGHYGGIVGHPFDDWAQYRALVARAKEEGADFIKIMISGIMDFSASGVLTEEGLEPEEIREMIRIAHGEGMAVMAHGNGDRPAAAALEAGVDSLEHGNYLSRDTLDLLTESSAVWVPTLAPAGNLLGCGRFPEEEVQKILKRQMECVSYAFKKGARLGLGSDAGAYRVPHGQGLLDEYGYMLEAVGRDQEESLKQRLRDSEAWIRRIFHNSSRQK